MTPKKLVTIQQHLTMSKNWGQNKLVNFENTAMRQILMSWSVAACYHNVRNACVIQNHKLIRKKPTSHRALADT